MNFPTLELAYVSPEIGGLVLAIIVLAVELFVTRNHLVLQWLTAAGLAVVIGLVIWSSGSDPVGAFSGMIVSDPASVMMKTLTAATALLAVLMSEDYRHGRNVRVGEYYGVMLLTTVGMMFLVSAVNLVSMFLGIETMSIGLYILAGSKPESPQSGEAALKYLLLGAFATGFLLFGMALVYGMTGGKAGFGDIGQALIGTEGEKSLLLSAGIGLMMVGLLFKVAAVPFHFWSPDVYQGAPTPVTAFMSAGPKAAAFTVFLRLLVVALPDKAALWEPVLWCVAILTMTVGNIIAISQTNIKRMLAYSSITHAGYMLVALLAAGDQTARGDAGSSLFFYLTAYYLMNIGAFAVAILVARTDPERDYHIESYFGLASRHPALALVMTLCMLSLAGIPPTAGFIGKLAVFTAGVKAGYVGLVVIAVLNSVVSVYYYLRIVVYMYMKPATLTARAALSPAMFIVLLIAAAGILELGIMPDGVMKWASAGASRISVSQSYSSVTETVPQVRH